MGRGLSVPPCLNFEEREMPYKSDAQRKFFHTKTAKKAGITKKDVKEWDSASKGKKLPEKKKASKGKK